MTWVRKGETSCDETFAICLTCFHVLFIMLYVMVHPFCACGWSPCACSIEQCFHLVLNLFVHILQIKLTWMIWSTFNVEFGQRLSHISTKTPARCGCCLTDVTNIHNGMLTDSLFHLFFSTRNWKKAIFFLNLKLESHFRKRKRRNKRFVTITNNSNFIH